MKAIMLVFFTLNGTPVGSTMKIEYPTMEMCRMDLNAVTGWNQAQQTLLTNREAVANCEAAPLKK